MNGRRSSSIREILTFLEDEKKVNPEDRYSIDENIRFISMCRNFPGFLSWYRNSLKKIDVSEITELTDFDNEKFILELHRKLAVIERRIVPGLVAPVVSAVNKLIELSDRPLLIAELGSGSMEIIRQIISKLLRKKFFVPPTFVAFDKSLASHEVAKENLSTYREYVNFIDAADINTGLQETLQNKRHGKINIVLSCDDILSPDKKRDGIKFDLVYHSFFRHHLKEDQKKRLDAVLADISYRVLEYDDFFSLFGLLIHAAYTWKNPVVLNGAVFSILRSPELKELEQQPGTLKIYKKGSLISWRGTYMRSWQTLNRNING